MLTFIYLTDRGPNKRNLAHARRHVRRHIAPSDVMVSSSEGLDSGVKRGPDGEKPEEIIAIYSVNPPLVIFIGSSALSSSSELRSVNSRATSLSGRPSAKAVLAITAALS